MVGKKKRNGTPNKNGKQVKPRQEEQAKPGKEAQAKGTDNKGARQTKLAFAATGQPEKPNDTTPPKASKAIQAVKKKLSFAEVTGTPQKARENDTTDRSTAITPEHQKGPTVTTTTKTPTKQDKTTTVNNNNDQNNESNTTPTKQDTTPKGNAKNEQNNELTDSDDDKHNTTTTTTNNKKKSTSDDTTEAIKEAKQPDQGTYNTPTKY
jgi:hypothetical protein